MQVALTIIATFLVVAGTLIAARQANLFATAIFPRSTLAPAICPALVVILSAAYWLSPWWVPAYEPSAAQIEMAERWAMEP